MAKRELSTTLRNLKFMQRASQREETKHKDEEKEQQQKPMPEDSVGASTPLAKRCVVIMEGNPHPGALKGRMSFQSFNPSIDKLHEDASTVCQTPASNVNNQNGSFVREDGLSPTRSDSNAASPGSNSDHKRKKPETNTETPSPSKLQKPARGDGSASSSSQNNSSGKQQKREKLDWNVLRPPKPQSKRS